MKNSFDPLSLTLFLSRSLSLSPYLSVTLALPLFLSIYPYNDTDLYKVFSICSSYENHTGRDERCGIFGVVFWKMNLVISKQNEEEQLRKKVKWQEGLEKGES